MVTDGRLREGHGVRPWVGMSTGTKPSGRGVEVDGVGEQEPSEKEGSERKIPPI